MADSATPQWVTGAARAPTFGTAQAHGVGAGSHSTTAFHSTIISYSITVGFLLIASPSLAGHCMTMAIVIPASGPVGAGVGSGLATDSDAHLHNDISSKRT